MDILNYAEELLLVNNKNARREAIASLSRGLQHERKWTIEHKREVRRLISWIESGSVDIVDLVKYH